MNTSKSIIIIPTYNEKENVVKMTQAIMGLNLELSILFVDDNSPDGTSRLISDLVEKFPDRVFFYFLHSFSNSNILVYKS